MAVAARTEALALFFPLVISAAFVIHFDTGWTTFEREDVEFAGALLCRSRSWSGCRPSL